VVRIDPDLPIVRGLSRRERAKVQEAASERSLEAGEVLAREGETVNQLFVLLSGGVELLRRDRRGTEYVVGDLGAGDLLGSSLEGRPRTATMRATKPSTVLMLPADLPRKHPKLMANVAHAMSARLRVQNDLSLEHAKERAAMGELLLKSVVLMCGYAVMLSALPWLHSTWPSLSTTWVSLPMIALFGYSSFRFLRGSGWPLSRFGLGFRNLPSSLFEAALLTPPFALVLIGVKWILVHVVPTYRGLPVIAHWDYAAQLADKNVQLLLVIYGASALVQELIVRCALQANMEDFLSGRGRTVAPIFAAALMFSVTHLHMSFLFAAMAFIPGMFWGWLFHRRRHLLGVTLSHFAIGAFVFFVLGVEMH
jgi:hypothetical protein